MVDDSDDEISRGQFSIRRTSGVNTVKLPKTTYDVVNEYNWPDNTELSSSLYKGKSCKSNGLYNKVYYKPNNQQYGVQGAVDSSSRITRLKYNTLQKADKFMGDKSNTKNECIRRNGIKTRC